MAYLNQNQQTGCAGPIPWLLRSPDLTLLFIFMGTYEWDSLQDQSIDGSGTLLRIMNAAVYL
jgi:hypothetical protein